MAKKPKTDREVAAFRERVRDAATRLFLERGPDNVTMRQIAAEMGVSPMTPYRYFRDKDEILALVRAAAFNQFAENLEQAVRAAGDARAKARAAGVAYLDFAHRFPDTYQLLFEHTQADEERYPELVKAHARANETMAGYVQEMIDAGLVRGDAKLIGYMFWATLHGTVVLEQTGALGRGVDVEFLRQTTMRTLFAGMGVLPPYWDEGDRD
ncbi:TetR/AcrR family transcriptional regulator [Alloalcanivorax sp. C16-1]|uniref:TetR/AcrR family transcriptional regulator n=1 Tax=Alloalcanivorax sp. C16-1 TaxID=3390051 RepID=UPI003970C7C6